MALRLCPILFIGSLLISFCTQELSMFLTNLKAISSFRKMFSTNITSTNIHADRQTKRAELNGDQYYTLRRLLSILIAAENVNAGKKEQRKCDIEISYAHLRIKIDSPFSPFVGHMTSTHYCNPRRG